VTALAALYLSVTIAFAIGLLRRTRPSSTDHPFVSVVIAARNEEAFIGRCLETLIDQTYPADRYEIIVVDDDSSDRTKEEVSRFVRVRCLKPSPEFDSFAAKKRPMATGIAASSGELILTTDADCTVSRTWIQTIVSHFSPEVDVVIGYSRIAPIAKGLAHRFQSFDFFALLSAAAGAAGLGRAWAATGQNFAYRRAVYDGGGGFSTISDRPSGDDVLLLQVLRRMGARVTFCRSREGHVTTWRSESFLGLINQRKRWASNAIYQLKLNPCFFAYITSVLTMTLLPLLALFLRGEFIALCVVAYGLRILFEGAVLLLGRKNLDAEQPIWFLPIWMLLQIPYILIVGVGGSILGFEWKGRSHTPSNTSRVSQTTDEQPDLNHATM
jgi:cellulose synthase/poly-beta-1,6-N-acetylglucosamine synthase-like glycosyltransferase